MHFSAYKIFLFITQTLRKERESFRKRAGVAFYYGFFFSSFLLIKWKRRERGDEIK